MLARYRPAGSGKTSAVPQLRWSLLAILIISVQWAAAPGLLADWRDDIGFIPDGGQPLPLVTYIPRGDSGWFYRKGLSEPTSTPAEWRALDFAVDATWQGGTAPIGYGDGDDATTLTDMRRSYSSVYLRKEFLIEGAIPESLLLRLYVDDGAAVWINGHEVARRHVPEGELAHNSIAFLNEASWERALLIDCNEYLVEGTNVLAILAINQSVTSSDFSIDVELLSPRVSLLQVEAIEEIEQPPESENFEARFLPQPYLSQETDETMAIAVPDIGERFSGSWNFSGQQFFIGSSSDDLVYATPSIHARTVGNALYGASTSLYPSLPEVELYTASDWANRIIGVRDSPPPLVEDAPIQNHSWVGATDGEEFTTEDAIDLLARLDYLIERDGVICIVGINNGSGTTVPEILAPAFNVISVGITTGDHSRGGTPQALAQPGRIRPDLVVPQNRTSWAAASVSSAAALLFDDILRRPKDRLDASRPQVMKALLLAGASTSEFVEWTHTPATPLDPILGAGELDIGNSRRILLSEKASEDRPQDAAWGFATASPGRKTSFPIMIPEGMTGSRFKASLCWHRQVENTSTTAIFDPTPTLADLTFKLVSGSGEEVGTSAAPIGTIEHLSLSSLASGDYALEITTDRPIDFGIAWDLETTPSQEPASTLVPRILIVIEGETVTAQVQNLMQGSAYRLEQSDDLQNWKSVWNFKATNSVMEWQPEEALPDRLFIRALLLE